MRHRKSLTLLALFALAALSLPATAAAQDNLVCFSPNHTVQQSTTGTYIRWEDNTFSDGSAITPWNFNPWGSTNLYFYFNGAANGGVVPSAFPLSTGSVKRTRTRDRLMIVGCQDAVRRSRSGTCLKSLVRYPNALMTIRSRGPDIPCPARIARQRGLGNER